MPVAKNSFSPAFLAFQEKYRLLLNEQQRAAVCAVDGPVLLLAVPGSGKTITLVARLGYMIEVCGIPPEAILTVTYTRAAAADMRQRFRRFFGAQYADRLPIHTINSLCHQIIREDAVTVRFSSGESKKLSRETVTERGLLVRDT